MGVQSLSSECAIFSSTATSFREETGCNWTWFAATPTGHRTVGFATSRSVDTVEGRGFVFRRGLRNQPAKFGTWNDL